MPIGRSETVLRFPPCDFAATSRTARCKPMRRSDIVLLGIPVFGVFFLVGLPSRIPAADFGRVRAVLSSSVGRHTTDVDLKSEVGALTTEITLLNEVLRLRSEVLKLRGDVKLKVEAELYEAYEV